MKQSFLARQLSMISLASFIAFELLGDGYMEIVFDYNQGDQEGIQNYLLFGLLIIYMYTDDAAENQLLELNLSKSNPALKILFPNDPKADITIQLKNLRFNLQKCHLTSSSAFFAERCSSSTTRIQISEPFQEQIFTNVLSLLFGYTILVDKSQMLEYFRIAKYLEIEEVVSKLKQDILSHPSNYNILAIIKLSHLYSDQQLFELCHEHLNAEEFAQLEYEQYELYQLDLSLLKLLIKMHKKYKLQPGNQGKGLCFLRIDQILKEYCRANRLGDDQYTELKYQLFDPNSLNAKEYKEIFLDQILIASLKNVEASSPMKLGKSMNDSILSTLLQSNASNELKLSMQHTFQKKKNNQLKTHNEYLQSELNSIRRLTDRNEQSYNEMNGQLKVLREELKKKETQTENQNKLIKKYQQMFLMMQKELEKKSEQIGVLTTKFEEFQNSKKPAVNIENNIFVESQFLPAHLFHDVMGNSFATKSKKST